MAIASVAFVLMVLFALPRPFRHDELFTFYMAQYSSFASLIERIKEIDLNPPLIYVITRGWQDLFGRSEVATRIPSAIFFLGASLMCIRFVAKRTGVWWAGASVCLFWCSAYFGYATEIRPYAQLLVSFSFVLISWDNATRQGRRGLWLAGIVAGELAMIESHIFSIFALLAILLAELVRTIRRRRIDWAVWAALLLPLAAMATYLPIMQRYHSTGVFPERFQGGPRKIAVFFAKLGLGIAIPFLAASLVAYLADRRAKDKPPLTPRFSAEDYGLLIGMLAPIVIVNALLMWTHGAFFERYCLTTALAATALAVLLLGRLCGYRRTPGIAAFAAILCIALWTNAVQPARRYFTRPPLDRFDALSPKLPLVAASGLAFLEMDHYEDAATVSRLHYLTDRKAAIQYANATIFEGMPDDKRYFPIRAAVDRYQDFVAHNRHFLVFGTLDFAEDWLLRKLLHDGASVRPIATFPLVWYNDHEVYEVTIPDGSPALQP